MDEEEDGEINLWEGAGRGQKWQVETVKGRERRKRILRRRKKRRKKKNNFKGMKE